MTHKSGANSLPLVIIDYGEGDLGLARFQHDVAPAAGNYWPVVFFCQGDQGHVIRKIDVEKGRSFLICKVALWSKEAAIEGLCACSLNSSQHVAPIFRPKAADFDLPTAAQGLVGGISGCI